MAYGSYKIGKLSLRFSASTGNPGYNFDKWNKWRQNDGFLCRNNNDCKWLDKKLDCMSETLSWTPNVSRLGLLADPVIQAIGSLEFEDGLRMGSPGEVFCD